MDPISKELLESLGAELMAAIQENPNVLELTESLGKRGVEVSFLLNLLIKVPEPVQKEKTRKFSEFLSRSDRTFLKGLRIKSEETK